MHDLWQPFFHECAEKLGVESVRKFGFRSGSGDIQSKILDPPARPYPKRPATLRGWVQSQQNRPRFLVVYRSLSRRR